MRTAQHSAESARMTNIAWPGGNLSIASDCGRASSVHDPPAEIEPTVPEPQNVIARYRHVPAGFPSEHWRQAAGGVLSISQLRRGRLHHLVSVDVHRQKDIVAVGRRTAAAGGRGRHRGPT